MLRLGFHAELVLLNTVPNQQREHFPSHSVDGLPPTKRVDGPRESALHSSAPEQFNDIS